MRFEDDYVREKRKLLDQIEQLREALDGLIDAARPYLDRAAPHEQLFSGEDLRNLDRLSSAVAKADAVRG